jgi:transcriptional antiterminator RfaH
VHTVPILPAENSIFPDNLLDPDTTSPVVRCWWAIYTKARQEKALARQLFQWEIPFYLPLVAKDNRIRGKVLRSYVPLFAGYIFLCASEEERIRALTTNRISRTLPIVDGQVLCHDLRQIHRLIESGAPLTVEHRLSPGRRVRVKSGGMMGLEGLVLSRRGGNRLLIAVNFLQQGASVAIDDFMVEPLD